MTDRIIDSALQIQQAAFAWATSQHQIGEKHAASILAASRASLDATREAARAVGSVITQAVEPDPER